MPRCFFELRERSKYWLLVMLGLVVIAGCSRDSSNPAELLERGRYLSDTERAAEAISVFERAVRLQPNNPELYYLRGLAKERTDDLNGAIEDYTRAVSINKTYSEAYNNRAVLQAQQGNFQAAVDDFTRVLQVSPKFVLGYKNRGLAWHDLGKYDEAMQDYNRALELEADSQGYFLRGNLQLEQKQYRAAVADYDAALKLDATNGRAWLNRGMALAYLKDMLAARESLRRAAESDSTIIAADVLAALEDVATAPNTGLNFSIERVRNALQEYGYQVTPDADELFPFRISRDGETRRLCVMLLPSAQDRVRLPLAASERLLNEPMPISLLIFSSEANEKGKYHRFLKQWKPTKADVTVAQVDVALGFENSMIP